MNKPIVITLPKDSRSGARSQLLVQTVEGEVQASFREDPRHAWTPVEHYGGLVEVRDN